MRPFRSIYKLWTPSSWRWIVSYYFTSTICPFAFLLALSLSSPSGTENVANNKLLSTDFLDRLYAENNFRFATHFFFSTQVVLLRLPVWSVEIVVQYFECRQNEWKKNSARLSLIANPFQNTEKIHVHRGAHHAPVGFSIRQSARYLLPSYRRHS